MSLALKAAAGRRPSTCFFSKSDQGALGKQRTHGRACPSACPVLHLRRAAAAAEKAVASRAAGAADDLPFFPAADGACPTEATKKKNRD